MLEHHLEVSVDEDKKFITFRVIGNMSNAAFVDQVMDFYRTLDSPWQYNKIFDYRRSTMFLEFGEIERMAALWSALVNGQPYRVRVAIITLDALDQVRAPSASYLFPNDEVKAVNTLRDALNWVTRYRGPPCAL